MKIFLYFLIMDENYKELREVKQEIKELEQKTLDLELKQETEGLSPAEKLLLKRLIEKLAKLEKKEEKWMDIIESSTKKRTKLEGESETVTKGSDQMDVDVIRTPFSLPDTITNEGVPGIFKTIRKDTILKFYDLLFPTSGNHHNVLFIKAPPYSGKTGFAQLLCQLLMEDTSRSVVYLRCNYLQDNESVASLFAETAKCDLKDFLHRNEERVLIMDEAQCSYSDSYFWKTIVKNALSSDSFPGFRLVILSSFGSFDPFRVVEREGTPIEIPSASIFGLYSQPGLNLQYEEFQEMIAGTIFADSQDDIWLLCSNHIGIACSTLNFLKDVFKKSSQAISQQQVQSALYSKKLLYNMYSRRGMPTKPSFSKMVEANKIDSEDRLRINSILDRVAKGENLKLNEEAFSAGSRNAAELLVKYGFLFEDDEKILQFASQMHLKVWLDSNRKDPEESFDMLSFDEFVVKAIGRMHSSYLMGFNAENNLEGVRERQIQMELYSAIVSLLPKYVYVTPEWRTANKKGYIDLVIRLENSMWFLELLVDGVDAIEHSQRFNIGGKYYPSLISNSRYALIDFRQKIRVRDFKNEFLYVNFTSNFEGATIRQSADNVRTISLLT
ncbi:hypothetical protein HDV06_005017 [Boothiomyces sp. JEL0866]|nr:hypothetical protein HDV06_005017 [Boothiomyces sp. JEL0866]